MNRITNLTPAILLIATITFGCASVPAGPPTARRVPDAAELSEWLRGAPKSASGEANYFIQMADTQLGMFAYPLPLLLLRAKWHDDQFERDARHFESAVRSANELKPAFVIICGDLVNRVGHAGQIAEFKRIAGMLDPNIPLYLVAGNHDVGGKPTKATLAAYRIAFGPDRYSFRAGDLYGIVLNSQIIDAPEHVPEESQAQLWWLRDELNRAKATSALHIVVFQHQSFFLDQPNEADAYFNIQSKNRAIYLDLFKDAGVEAVFAGHYHRNARGRAGELEMITTGPVGKPMGKDPSGFRIVEILDDSLHDEYFSLNPPN